MNFNINKTQEPSKPYWEVKNLSKESSDLYLYGSISSYCRNSSDGGSIRTIMDDLKKLGNIKHLNLYINSPGGSVSEGVTIAQYLARQPYDIDVYVDALAASIASVVAVGCGGTLHMYKSSMLMIHRASSWGGGNAKDFRKTADILEKHDKIITQFYIDKCGDKISEETLNKFLDNETWLSAEDCIKYGFSDVIEKNEINTSACLDGYEDVYNNIPETLISNTSPDEPEAPQIDPVENDTTIPEDVQNVIKRARKCLDEYSNQKSSIY